MKTKRPRIGDVISILGHPGFWIYEGVGLALKLTTKGKISTGRYDFTVINGKKVTIHGHQG